MAETTASRLVPRVRQLYCFLDNRVGVLQRLVTLLEEEKIRICGISIVEAADYAVVRLVVDRPGPARQALTQHGYSVLETDILGVAFPPGGDVGIRRVLGSLLRAELNVLYIYSLLVQVQGRSVLAVNVEDLDEAGWVLERAGLHLVTQEDMAL